MNKELERLGDLVRLLNLRDRSNKGVYMVYKDGSQYSLLLNGEPLVTGRTWDVEREIRRLTNEAEVARNGR